MRAALLWIIKPTVVVIGFLKRENGTDKLSRNVSKKFPLLAV